MKKLLFTIFVAVFSFQFTYASLNDTLIIGTWKGTSVCQIKSSPCHDELAAYHLSKGDKPGIYHIVANKIINGVEEDMGAFDFSFEAGTGTLTYTDEARDAVWKFKVSGNKMEGTLHYKGQLFRIIKLTKEK